MNQLFRNQKGEIATILTLITVGLMGIGVAVGSYLAQHTTQLQSNAADCATISDVTQSPDSDIDPEAHFTCNVTIDQNHSGSKNISCGWSKNGDWPQTGGFWDPAATCAGINCTFGIAAPKENEITEGAVFELVGFDMSPGCGPQSGMRKPFKLKGAKEPPPGDDENICKDKPDGYRAKYDVHEECDTALKKWVIIDGICRDGEVKNEPACATCDSCGDGDTTRDAKASSLARNECTPRGCDAPPPDDNGGGGGGGGGNGGGSGNGNNSNWCTKPDYNPVTCHVGPILLNQPPCFEASFCRDSTFTCDTISNYFKPFTDYFKSFLPQDLIKNIFQSNVCSDKSCPSDESRLQCHGTDPEGECYAVSLCTKESKCSDVAGPAQALVNLQDGPCPLPKDNAKTPPPNGAKGKIGGIVTVYNPDSKWYRTIRITFCDKNNTPSSCKTISIDADGYAGKDDQWKIDDGKTLNVPYEIDSIGNGESIVQNGTYLAAKIQLLDGEGKVQYDDPTLDTPIPCSSFPCRHNFEVIIGKGPVGPLSIEGTVQVEGANPESVAVHFCTLGASPCPADRGAMTNPTDGDPLWHFRYTADEKNVPLKKDTPYFLIAEARDKDMNEIGQSQSINNKTPDGSSVALKITAHAADYGLKITGKVQIDTKDGTKLPKVSLCQYLSGKPDNCSDPAMLETDGNTTGVYTYAFDTVSPGEKMLFIDSKIFDKNGTATSLNGCSKITAECQNGENITGVANGCHVTIVNQALERNFTATILDPANSITGEIKIGFEKPDLYKDVRININTAKSLNQVSSDLVDRNKIHILNITDTDSQQVIHYAICELNPDILYAVNVNVYTTKEGNNLTKNTFRQPMSCTSSQPNSTSIIPNNYTSDQSKTQWCIVKPKGESNWGIGIAETDDAAKNLVPTFSQSDLEEALRRFQNEDGDEGAAEYLSAVIHGLTKSPGLQMKPCNPQWGECDVAL